MVYLIYCGYLHFRLAVGHIPREIRGKEGAVSNEKRKQLSIRDKLWQQYSQVRDNE